MLAEDGEDRISLLTRMARNTTGSILYYPGTEHEPTEFTLVIATDPVEQRWLRDAFRLRNILGGDDEV